MIVTLSIGTNTTLVGDFQRSKLVDFSVIVYVAGDEVDISKSLPPATKARFKKRLIKFVAQFPRSA